MAIDESLAVRVLEGSPTMSPTSNTETKPKDVIRDARENGIKIVDLRFTDLLGSWQHFSIPVGELTETLFSEGIGFDGSSIRGFQKIYESDMLLFPDPDRTFVDSTLEIPTLAIVCDIKDPLTLANYSRDPRLCRAQSRGVPAQHRHRRHVVLGPRVRVLHLQLGALRPEHPRGLLPHRFRRGHLEHREERHREPRLPAEVEVGLLPDAAGRQAPGSAQQDRARADRRGRRRSRSTTTRSAPPGRPRSTCGSTRS